MKKILLSVALIATFAAYAVYQRVDSDEARVTAQPAPITTTPSETAPQQKSGSAAAPPSVPSAAIAYHDGEFTGDKVDVYYGNVQVKTTIVGGKIQDVQFLDYPQDRGTSDEISAMAMPILKSEAIKAQSAEVDIVSGATQTSTGFKASLHSTLMQAHAQQMTSKP